MLTDGQKSMFFLYSSIVGCYERVIKKLTCLLLMLQFKYFQEIFLLLYGVDVLISVLRIDNRY